MYKKGNKDKIIISLVLLIVLGISIGYANFTNTLKITSGALVTPDSATFDIDFSSSSTGVIGNNITPTLVGTDITAEPAVINNTTSPTLTNLKVNFTEPGQKAVYTFYAYNNGEHLAYLNSINYLNVNNYDEFIKCEGEVGTNYVSDACSGINVTINVGGLEVSDTKENIHSHKLESQRAEKIVLTIEYNEVENRADGNVNITFGDITLIYTTVDSEAPVIACNYNGDLVQGAEYVDGQYTYRYKQEISESDSLTWVNISADGWGVKLTDSESSAPVTSNLCTTINGKPIVSMSNMFHGSQAVSIDVSSFDTSHVVNMNGMFKKTIATSINLDNFDTSSVTLMGGVFHTTKFNSLDVSSFNTSNVTYMHWMFANTEATEIIGLTNFDTSNVKYMNGAFYNSKASVLDLSNFDTSNVLNMDTMFGSVRATTGYARTQEDADKFNDASVTNIPSSLIFQVKQ